MEDLEGDRVYLFTGRADKVVNPATVHRAEQLYLSLGIANEDLKLVDVDRLPARAPGHSWVTVDYGGPCDANTDSLHRCLRLRPSRGHPAAHLRQAEAALSESLSGKFIEFPQAEFAPHGRPVENGPAASTRSRRNRDRAASLRAFRPRRDGTVRAPRAFARPVRAARPPPGRPATSGAAPRPATPRPG